MLFRLLWGEFGDLTHHHSRDEGAASDIKTTGLVGEDIDEGSRNKEALEDGRHAGRGEGRGVG